MHNAVMQQLTGLPSPLLNSESKYYDNRIENESKDVSKCSVDL